MKMLDQLVAMQKEDQKKFESYKFVQERVDLFFEENRAGINKADSEHNLSGRVLSGQLITTASIVIGLVTLVFGQQDLLNSLDGYQKSFLFTGLVFLFLSLVAGALEVWDSMQHFKKVSVLFARANKDAPIQGMEDIKELHKFRNSLFDGVSASSKSRGLIMQVAFLGFASVLYLILFATVLF